VNGTETHLHLAIHIEPFVTISDLVKELKGASAFELNQRERSKRLEWQRGYGVVSFGKRQLPWVLDYIVKQKEHHGRGTAKRRLELAGFDEGE
jgi:REP element-mobilizing transposase RayT